MVLYFAFALDVVTTFCFILFRKIKFPLANMQQPVADMMSVLDLHNLHQRNIQRAYVHDYYIVFPSTELASSSIESAPMLPLVNYGKRHEQTCNTHQASDIRMSHHDIVQFSNQALVFVWSSNNSPSLVSYRLKSIGPLQGLASNFPISANRANPILSLRCPSYFLKLLLPRNITRAPSSLCGMI